MTAKLGHRGPDAQDILSATGVVLGHTRLSINDRDAGGQPRRVVGRDKRCVYVAFGGEIYNRRELSATLPMKPPPSWDETEAELLGHGFMAWGVALFQRIEGMFSIAIWDPGVRELVLARDQLGIKPLFYSTAGAGLYFASEQGALLEVLPAAIVDREGVCELFGMWPYRMPGSGIYQSVRELEPGNYLTYDGRDVKSSRYWHVSFEPTDISEPEATRYAFELLNRSVSQQSQADTPITALLSGGLDSSAIVALSALNSSVPSDAFTLVLSDADERFRPSVFRPDRDLPFAQLLANTSSVHLHTLAIGDDALVRAEARTTDARDVPDNADLDTSLLLLFREVATRYKVCLVGEGADELYGGYAWFSDPAWDDGGLEFPWTRLLGFPREFLRDSVEGEVKAYVADAKRQLLDRCPVDASVVDEDALKAMTISYLDQTIFLAGQLERMDRISMSQGVEVRVPFCTAAMAQFTWNLPSGWKGRGGVEKALLRKAVSHILPERVVHRRKSSYPTALGATYEAHLRQQVADRVVGTDWAFSDLLEHNTIRRALSDSKAAPASRPSIWLGQLWSLFRWADRYGIDCRM